MDLDIERFDSPPRRVADTIIKLKTELLKVGSNKIVVVSPQCVTVYQDKPAISPDSVNIYWNYFVPIINLADPYIDFYQVQAYNDWY